MKWNKSKRIFHRTLKKNEPREMLIPEWLLKVNGRNIDFSVNAEAKTESVISTDHNHSA